jgi:hypothetical protein
MQYYQKISLVLFLPIFSCISMQECRIHDYHSLNSVPLIKKVSPAELEEIIVQKINNNSFNVHQIKCYSKGALAAKVWPLKTSDRLHADYSKKLNPHAVQTIIIMPDHKTFDEIIKFLQDYK